MSLGEAEMPHAEIMTTILTLRNGSSHTIVGPDLSASLYSKLSASGKVPVVNTYKSTRLEADINHNPVLYEGRPDASQATESILEALRFRAITHRHASIEEAHRQTFQWIYEPPSRDQNPWDDFSQWLKNGLGCYWISGKAGSGKSTLMKFVQSNPITTSLLGQWASGSSSQLIFGSYYFWHAGTQLQKSQEGLLRSLLYDVLYQVPELVPVLFPSISRSLLAGTLQGHLELSFLEVKLAFMDLARSTLARYKFCFFVDGIDEYDGDCKDICEFCREMSASPSIKMLLSSRPIPSCVSAFTCCPQLRVQDLTRNDIQQYIKDSLSMNSLLQRLESSENGCTRRLTEAIRLKAAGVFLWVKLVIRRLLTGLEDYDTIHDLLNRLEEVPPELYSLYDHMLGSMSSSHRQQGSKLLQMVLRSSEIHGNYPMTLLQLSFAEEEDYRKVIRDPVCHISQEDIEQRCEAMEGRMRSRCCGLIEALKPSSESGACYKSEYVVEFLHISVAEFLQSSDIRARLSLITQGTAFNVDKALLGSSLKELQTRSPTWFKTTSSGNVWDHPGDWPRTAALRLSQYKRNMEPELQQVFLEYVLAIRHTMINSWQVQEADNAQDTRKKAQVVATNRSHGEFSYFWSESFLVLAAHYFDPVDFLELITLTFRSEALQALEHLDPQFPLLTYLLVRFVNETRPYALRFLVENVRELCFNGLLDVNEAIFPQSEPHIWKNQWDHALQVKHWTIWEFVLHFIWSLLLEERQHVLVAKDSWQQWSRWGRWGHSFLEFLSEMIMNRADVNQTIFVKGNETGVELSAWVVIMALLNTLWRDVNSYLPLISPGTAGAAFVDVLALKFEKIEGSMRRKGAKRIIRIVPLKATARTFGLRDLSICSKRHQATRYSPLNTSRILPPWGKGPSSKEEITTLKAAGFQLDDMGDSSWKRYLWSSTSSHT